MSKFNCENNKKYKLSDDFVSLIYFWPQDQTKTLWEMYITGQTHC